MKIAIFIQRDSEGLALFVRFLSKVRPFQIRVNSDGTTSSLILTSSVATVNTTRYKADGWKILEL